MKQTFTFLIFLLTACITQAQSVSTSLAVPTTQETTYRRSSLYTLMVDQKNLPKADVIKDVFIKSPIPDKFNDHNLTDRVIIVDPSSEGIANYLQYQNIARSLVAKWFNRSPKGGFNMNLIADRGSYNATEMDAAIAQSTKVGLAKLADAGEELIGNTFVLVSVYKFINEEEIAQRTNQGLSILASVVGKTTNTNISSVTTNVSKAVTIAGKGYIVVAKTHLFQLNWNDSVAAVFYNNYWTTDDNLDLSRKQAFDNSNIFSLKYIGVDQAQALAQSSTYSQKTDEQLIEKAEKNAVDKVIAKLQKKHEVFRTKTPLYSIDPLSAKIGLKEGLEKGDKYEVLEQTVDKNGRTVYKSVGTIKVDGDQIWDNEFYATGETPSTGNYIDRTLFTGDSKKFYPGMLIRQK